MKVRMHPTEAAIKNDLDTVFVAIDRLKVHGWEHRYRLPSRTTTEVHTGRSDLDLARHAFIALANIRERIEYSVPVEQKEMEMEG